MKCQVLCQSGAIDSFTKNNSEIGISLDEQIINKQNTDTNLGLDKKEYAVRVVLGAMTEDPGSCEDSFGVEWVPW